MSASRIIFKTFDSRATTLERPNYHLMHPSQSKQTNNSATVVCDTNVLFNSFVRDLLIRLAMVPLYKAQWSDHILEELSKNLMDKRSFSKEDTDVLIHNMNISQGNKAMIYDYQPLIKEYEQDFGTDAHVIAAAKKIGAKYIVTFNTKHFQDSKMQHLNIKALHPDLFLHMFLINNPDEFLLCVQNAIQFLMRSGCSSMIQYLERLRKHELFKTAEYLHAVHLKYRVSQYISDNWPKSCEVYFIGTSMK